LAIEVARAATIHPDADVREVGEQVINQLLSGRSRMV
jgi:hypothetical protein